MVRLLDFVDWFLQMACFVILWEYFPSSPFRMKGTTEKRKAQYKFYVWPTRVSYLHTMLHPLTNTMCIVDDAITVGQLCWRYGNAGAARRSLALAWSYSTSSIYWWAETSSRWRRDNNKLAREGLFRLVKALHLLPAWNSELPVGFIVAKHPKPFSREWWHNFFHDFAS